VLLEKRQESDMRELNKSLNDYRKTFQRKEDTREFDLNDPDSLKNDKPARISDDDPRLGVSSLQKFSGEDLNSKGRKKLQQEQTRYSFNHLPYKHGIYSNGMILKIVMVLDNCLIMQKQLLKKKLRWNKDVVELPDRGFTIRKMLTRNFQKYNSVTFLNLENLEFIQIASHITYDVISYLAIDREWCKQQMNERSQEEANFSQANRLYDLKARELDQRAVELAESERQCREAINLATAKYNAALARETKTNQELAKTQEQDDNFTEISNQIFGDILTENPDVAQSAFGAHRVIPDRWKGMSPAQVNEIRRKQHDQMLEKQVQNIAEKHDQLYSRLILF
jgi:hypothetical protein